MNLNELCKQYNGTYKVADFSTVQVYLFWGETIPGNNIIAFDRNGNELWKINDLLKIKDVLEFVDIKKVSDNTFEAYYSLGIIYTVDIARRKIVNTTYVR